MKDKPRPADMDLVSFRSYSAKFRVKGDSHNIVAMESNSVDICRILLLYFQAKLFISPCFREANEHPMLWQRM